MLARPATRSSTPRRGVRGASWSIRATSSTGSEESVNTILELAQLKSVAGGALAHRDGLPYQRYGGEILKEITEVNAILGTSELDRIVAIVNQADGRRDG